MLDSIGQTISPNSIIVYSSKNGLVLAKVSKTTTIERMGYDYSTSARTPVVKKTERISCNRVRPDHKGKLSLGYNTITLSSHRVVVINPADFSPELKAVLGGLIC